MRHNRLVGAEELLGLHDTVQLPVSPEDEVLKNCQRVRMEQVVIVGDDLLAARAV